MKMQKSNIAYIRGCYVNDKREIVSEFRQSFALTPQEEIVPARVPTPSLFSVYPSEASSGQA